MNPLALFEPTMARILAHAKQQEAEAIVSTGATLAGYCGIFYDIISTFGSILAWPTSPAAELLPDVPLIWLKDELTGEPTYGRTGFGFFPNRFNPSGPDPQQLSAWISAADTVMRHTAAVSVSEFMGVFPEFPLRMFPVFEAMIAASTDDEAERVIEEQLRVLKDTVNGKLWVFCCATDTGSAVTSADGLDAMAGSLRQRSIVGPSPQCIEMLMNTLAYRLQLDAAGWSVIEWKRILGLTRPMPQGAAWFRTAASIEWNRIDDRGFGVIFGNSSSNSGNGLFDFLGQFSSVSSTVRILTDVNTEAIGSVYPILAALSGYPTGRTVKSMRPLTGQMWNLCRPLSQKGEVTYWWLM